MATKIRVIAKAQNRLALGIIRAYTLLYPATTLEDIHRVFPREINPDSGVKDNFIDVTHLGQAQGNRWHGFFDSPDELIALCDGTRMCITKMWTGKSLNRLQLLANTLDIEAVKVKVLPQQTSPLPAGVNTPKYRLEFLNGWTPALAEQTSGLPETITEDSQAHIPVYLTEEDKVPKDVALLRAELDYGWNKIQALTPEHVAIIANERRKKNEYTHNPNNHQATTPTHEVSRLTKTVADDLRAFFQQMVDNPSPTKKNIFFNEKDLQLHLALWLTALKNEDGTPKYDDVDMEYFIPIRELPDYVWSLKNGLNVDLVVQLGDEYVPIELKYTTDTVNFTIKRFGEELADAGDIIKYQGAQNLVMYNFWKDVKRLEVLKKRFARVSGGIALFVTNDTVYLRDPKEYASSYPFSTADGLHGSEKHWKGKPKVAADKPDFDLSQAYHIAWQAVNLDGAAFHYNLIEI